MNSIPAHIRNGYIAGTIIGGGLAIYLFNTNQWYHDFLISWYSSPLMWAIAIPLGIAGGAIAIAND
tara:strand:- start:211 stop:408 length:198 start_codon:yes stop_codon:yes gene_type:complete